MTEISLNKQFEELIQATMQEQEDIDESTKRQDFCQDNNAIKKKNAGETRHNNTNKSRNYLSNISYYRVVKEDLYNRNFVFNIYVLLTKNLNPFSLERKRPD